MVTVRVTASTAEYGGEGYVEGDLLAVPDDIADQMITAGGAERAEPVVAAKRRERATAARRETR